MKQLKDGETKVIRASRNWSMFRHKNFEVTAERYDSETPFVHLRVGKVQSAVITMTDVETLDLIERLQNAIGILPSSK